ncbi:MAG TPA: ABC transporter ATP-binding protein [Thermomicrobiales bacterium]|nr:ABC transporter ATP-binding protein [Thermomicrobiales bacterium]
MSKLVLTDVTKIYGSGEATVTALDGASLSVAAGELVALVGPSGSGKTTFLAIAGALLAPTRGRVTLDGQDLTALAPAARARFRLAQIGFVLQASNLVPYLTARDQLLLVTKLAGDKDREAPTRAARLLGELGLERRLGHYPDELSGGERQRVAIARALMNDPGVILADEPTASLDSRRGREVVELLRREVKARRKAAILVTHDERMLDLCDRVVHIADGRLQGVPAVAPAAALAALAG